MITPHTVRASITACQGWAQGDPEAWHSFVDKARADVLKAITDADIPTLPTSQPRYSKPTPYPHCLVRLRLAHSV